MKVLSTPKLVLFQVLGYAQHAQKSIPVVVVDVEERTCRSGPHNKYFHIWCKRADRGKARCTIYNLLIHSFLRIHGMRVMVDLMGEGQ